MSAPDLEIERGADACRMLGRAPIAAAAAGLAFLGIARCRRDLR